MFIGIMAPFRPDEIHVDALHVVFFLPVHRVEEEMQAVRGRYSRLMTPL
jgi:hypothetical protein